MSNVEICVQPIDFVCMWHRASSLRVCTSQASTLPLSCISRLSANWYLTNVQDYTKWEKIISVTVLGKWYRSRNKRNEIGDISLTTHMHARKQAHTYTQRNHNYMMKTEVLGPLMAIFDCQLYYIWNLVKSKWLFPSVSVFSWWNHLKVENPKVKTDFFGGWKLHLKSGPHPIVSSYIKNIEENIWFYLLALIPIVKFIPPLIFLRILRHTNT